MIAFFPKCGMSMIVDIGDDIIEIITRHIMINSNTHDTYYVYLQICNFSSNKGINSKLFICDGSFYWPMCHG